MGRERLQAGELRMSFDPDLGGAILSLSHEGQDLLRPADGAAADVLDTACFPLAPYANRIADGRFTYAGRKAELSRNMAGQVHPLHGEGWRAAWRLEDADATSATMTFQPAATEWPWRYRARQSFRLNPHGLMAELAVTNLDDAAGPFGLGFHPYFPHSSTARLTAQTTGMWIPTPDLLPVEHVTTAPWSTGAPVRTERLIDHCYTGWRAPARIDLGPGRPALSLTASPEMRWLHVYAPPDQDLFCVEPVSHAPNALNMRDPQAQGVQRLDPGETLAVWMRLDLM